MLTHLRARSSPKVVCENWNWFRTLRHWTATSSACSNILLYYANCPRIESNLHRLVAWENVFEWITYSSIRRRREIIERKRFYRRVTINIWNGSGHVYLKEPKYHWWSGKWEIAKRVRFLVKTKNKTLPY
jgi:hypothetical protein